MDNRIGQFYICLLKITTGLAAITFIAVRACDFINDFTFQEYFNRWIRSKCKYFQLIFIVGHIFRLRQPRSLLPESIDATTLCSLITVVLLECSIVSCSSRSVENNQSSECFQIFMVLRTVKDRVRYWWVNGNPPKNWNNLYFMGAIVL